MSFNVNDVSHVLNSHVPEELKEHHRFQTYIPFANMGLDILCLCGWRRNMSYDGISNNGVDTILSILKEHVGEELEKLNPTLKEMEEWGWFAK